MALRSSSKIVTLALLAGISSLAHAQALTPQSVALQSLQLTQLIRSNQNVLSQAQVLHLNQLLLRAQAVVLNTDPGPGPLPPGPIDPGPFPPGPGPGPGPYPPPVASFDYEATCHIDDDPQFDFDQQIAGSVTGPTVQSLVEQCRALAQASYGANGSSGLKNIQIRGTIPPDFNTATCHIDDDPNFDFDQFVFGTLAARTVQELVAECDTVAHATYGANGSSGIKDLNAGRVAPPYLKSGDCNIDDDPNFDPNQIVVGQVFGTSVPDLIQQCQAVAQDIYPGKGSSGVLNIH